MKNLLINAVSAKNVGTGQLTPIATITGGITDVKIGNSSLVSGGIATIPSSDTNVKGVISVSEINALIQNYVNSLDATEVEY